ncbi:Sacchrp-dh-NADP domain-containing protein [Aphelenchoides fujianensis]|nr:Sacchrp-dh-NADP domain-containing protein [Aphelenchoides fujianensis]
MMADRLADRKFDLVVFGATGCAGAYIVEEFVKSEYFGRHSIAVAGRNADKLRRMLGEVSKHTNTDLSRIEVIIADSSDDAALDALAKQTRVIVNAAGPFWKFGEHVIRAAVRNGTSHLDISGEAVWAERMQVTYNREAKESGSIVISSCAFDSIPADLGVQFLRQQFPGTVAYAECFVKFDIPRGYSFNFGTLETVLRVVERGDRVDEFRAQLMPEPIEQPLVKPPKRPPVWRNRSLNGYAIPYPGDRLPGADDSVVERTQYHEATVNGRRPIPVSIYALDGTWAEARAKHLWFGVMVGAVRRPACFRFVLNHPKLASLGTFTTEGPKREMVKKARFTYFVQGYGWPTEEPQVDQPPTTKLTVRCDGPDAGYVGTARLILASAMTILEERDQMPEGGVFTPAVAFERTRIFDRLAQWDITFRVDTSVDPALMA